MNGCIPWFYFLCAFSVRKKKSVWGKNSRRVVVWGGDAGRRRNLRLMCPWKSPPISHTTTWFPASQPKPTPLWVDHIAPFPLRSPPLPLPLPRPRRRVEGEAQGAWPQGRVPRDQWRGDLVGGRRPPHPTGTEGLRGDGMGRGSGSRAGARGEGERGEKRRALGVAAPPPPHRNKPPFFRGQPPNPKIHPIAPSCLQSPLGVWGQWFRRDWQRVYDTLALLLRQIPLSIIIKYAVKRRESPENHVSFEFFNTFGKKSNF